MGRPSEARAWIVPRVSFTVPWGRPMGPMGSMGVPRDVLKKPVREQPPKHVSRIKHRLTCSQASLSGRFMSDPSETRGKKEKQ